MIFCCDINEEGTPAVLGRLGELPLAELIGRWLRTCGDLQTERARCIADSEMRDGFDSCANNRGARRALPLCVINLPVICSFASL